MTTAYLLVQYSLSSLRQTEKVKFFYALKGRGKKQGLLDTTGALSLARSVLLIHYDQLDIIDNFFTTWKCDYHMRKVYITPDQMGRMYDLGHP